MWSGLKIGLFSALMQTAAGYVAGRSRGANATISSDRAIRGSMVAVVVSATFFCTGQRVDEHPALVRRIVNEGHLLGNHSFAHSHWTNFFTVRRLREDVGRAQEAIARVAGCRPTLFRPPVGLTNPRVFRVVKELRLQVVGWTVRGLDTRHGKPEAIVERIVRRLRPGAILVLHDGGMPCSIVLPTVDLLLAELQRRGYRAERLDRLMETT